MDAGVASVLVMIVGTAAIAVTAAVIAGIRAYRERRRRLAEIRSDMRRHLRQRSLG
jgi:hypothetical protein